MHLPHQQRQSNNHSFDQLEIQPIQQNYYNDQSPRQLGNQFNSQVQINQTFPQASQHKKIDILFYKSIQQLRTQITQEIKSNLCIIFVLSFAIYVDLLTTNSLGSSSAQIIKTPDQTQNSSNISAQNQNQKVILPSPQHRYSKMACIAFAMILVLYILYLIRNLICKYIYLKNIPLLKSLARQLNHQTSQAINFNVHSFYLDDIQPSIQLPQQFNIDQVQLQTLVSRTMYNQHTNQQASGNNLQILANHLNQNNENENLSINLNFNQNLNQNLRMVHLLHLHMNQQRRLKQVKNLAQEIKKNIMNKQTCAKFFTILIEFYQFYIFYQVVMVILVEKTTLIEYCVILTYLVKKQKKSLAVLLLLVFGFLAVVVGVVILGGKQALGYLFPRRFPQWKKKGPPTLPNSQKLTEQTILESDGSCSICFQDYSVGTQVIRLKCSQKHMFHPLCINGWIKVKQTCPLCRKSIEDNQEIIQQQPQN